MPPWVARQWHVWRGPHSAPGAWRCTQRLARQPSVLTSRPYSAAGPDDKSYTFSRANSAIIIPRSVHVQPQDLIAHIQPIARDRLTKDRLVVFFVTPAFATWLLDDEVFLRKALRQTYANLLSWEDFPYARIHALCAVVDKLPTPTAIGGGQSPVAAALERMHQPPVSETGYEGMAYTTLRYWDGISAHRLQPAVRDDKPAISFITSERTDSTGYFADALRLPLANTVFQTGLPSTMQYSTWHKKKKGNDLELRKTRNITQHGLKFHRCLPTKESTSALAVPLIPLTEPRRVDASMGNILRRVIGPDGKSVSASQELERIVPRYHNARGESSRTTSVWALLIPKELMVLVLKKTAALLGRQSHVGESSTAVEDELWEALWKRDPTPWNDLVPTAIASSARLHRVLSGGGGWGKKAGLLSLDPVAEGGQTPAPSISDGPNDLSSALQQAAHDGDYIQFFISPSTTSPASIDQDAQSKRLKELAEIETPWGWELGTVPSTVDVIPGGSWQHEAPASKDTFVFKHSFGALAEGGITLHRHFKLKQDHTYSLISGSKIDVPFSRFSAVNTEAEEESMGENVGNPEIK
ncbi:hypothetical protein K458DRAFT_413429 [Lentithecium fluviatile CBS 122367]|uniref:Uncharacterized protein n=1 Tax=Lentithecium fluviatile CBS 122367 TaxID=1168545 RepID=A0A6G1JFW6_9PLEO|nr:hypothetical protein K458DRAFT_413429 [Lentithecium fluviatile CBS 122367]